MRWAGSLEEFSLVRDNLPASACKASIFPSISLVLSSADHNASAVLNLSGLTLVHSSRLEETKAAALSSSKRPAEICCLNDPQAVTFGSLRSDAVPAKHRLEQHTFVKQGVWRSLLGSERLSYI